MIFKRSFLPNVLATQISIASVIPLLFAAIYFITKKAVLLSKIAIIVTSVVSVATDFRQLNEHASFLNNSKVNNNNRLHFSLYFRWDTVRCF